MKQVQVTGKNYAGQQVGLFYEKTKKPVMIGDITPSGIVKGGSAPHKESSTGRVWLVEDTWSQEYFPSVIDANWQELNVTNDTTPA